MAQALGNGPGVGSQRDHRAQVNVVELAQAVQVAVDDGHVGAQAVGDLGRVVAHHAAAQDHHVGGRDAGDPAQQYSAPAIGRFQVFRAHLHRHPARHFAHRGQARQRAVLLLNGLVSDGCHPGFQQLGRQFGDRRQVQVGEQREVGAEKTVLGGLRLLHLDDDLSAVPDLRGAGNDPRAGLLILFVGEAGKLAGAGLNQYLVASLHKFADAVRHQPHAGFVVFHFSGNAYDHGKCPSGDRCGASLGAGGGSRLGPRPRAMSVNESSLPRPLRLSMF